MASRGSLLASSAVALAVAVALVAARGAAAVGIEANNRQSALEAAWGQELDPETKVKAYASPVKRVVNLLQKMKSELEAEASKESEMYDKMVCWCETNEKEKTKAVSDAEALDVKLSSEIEELSARHGVLTAEVADTKQEIGDNTARLQQATAIREDEAAKFREEEKDMVQAITNLKNAIAVLSKHQGTQALLQLDGSMLAGMRVLLRDAAEKYEAIVATRAERRLGSQPKALLALKAETAKRSSDGDAQGAEAVLRSALNIHDGTLSDVLPLRFAARYVAEAADASGSKTFLQVSGRQPLYESRSAARSAGIYGLLQQMLEEFEAELAAAQKDDSQALADFKALAAAKTAQISAGKAKLDEMQEEDSSNEKSKSDAKEDLGITRNQRSGDVEFLRNLQTTCNDLDAQWEKRSKTRAAETKAVAEAIAILTEDDNREMLAKSVTLLQERSVSVSVASAAANARRASALAVLQKAAGSPDLEADDLLAAWHGRQAAAAAPTLGAAAGPRAQLSTLAMAVQLDSFAKVKKMMDTMIAEMKEQQAEEVKFKDYCETELKDNERTVYAKTELKEDLEADIARLEALISKLTEEIAHAKSQIAATQLEIKQASQTREEENKEFQSVVADQRATQSILRKALMKLKDFYSKGINKLVLVQKSKQAPPVQFNDYKANAGSNSVIGLIEQIVEDSKALEGETTAGETKAQAEYESFVKDSNALISDLGAAVTAKTRAVAAAKADSAQAGADLDSTVGELDSLAAYEADLHAQCDFVLKNFDIRQKARLQEIEAIQSAKAILSGEQ